MNEKTILKQDELIENILKLWELEEYYNPLKFPNSAKCCNEYNYDLHRYIECIKNENSKCKSEDEMYNRINLYCGNYTIKDFILKIAEKYGFDENEYEDIYKITGNFYIFSIQINLDGNITEEGFKISPFFYALVRIIQEDIDVDIKFDYKDIETINEFINNTIKQDDYSKYPILKSEYLDYVKGILFNKLKIESDEEIGLQDSSYNRYAYIALKKDDKDDDLNSYYIDEIEMIKENYKNNELIKNYITALSKKDVIKINIDADINAIQKWLEVDRYPLAKYPSRFSPTLMQQVAINIAISESDRKEKIFSVNGPPGTGKTTLLKEIVASNVEKMAEALISYGISYKKLNKKETGLTSNSEYVDVYYEIPKEISKYGILVASSNNGAVENVTLDLPIKESVKENKTWTDHFDRDKNEEIYFSKVADKLLDKQDGGAWGLISARMGKKDNIAKVIEYCIFKKSNDDPDKITLDFEKRCSLPWEQAVKNFNDAKEKVLLLREDIKADQLLLKTMYEKKEKVENDTKTLNGIKNEISQLENELDKRNNELESNKQKTLKLEEEISYIKKYASFIDKILSIIHLGKIGRRIYEKRNMIKQLILEYDKIICIYNLDVEKLKELKDRFDKMQKEISIQKKEIDVLKEMIYLNNDSLKQKYKDNLADKEFYLNLAVSKKPQNYCPWTFDTYDKAREELFYAALQVRKAFILESNYVRRNLFVYKGYLDGNYNNLEKEKIKEMFPHLINTLLIVIPVISTTFASVRSFLKYAGNKSLGMLIIDEAGQAVPQAALGAIYRSKSVVVVGDPLQIEPVVNIPQIIVNMLSKELTIPQEYTSIENSVQVFADKLNEFNGKIGDRNVGCPLLVHRRCIDPMFSISNMISYNDNMINMTKVPEKEQIFLIKESCWININGDEEGNGNHFVKKQADKVCELLDCATKIYDDLFNCYDKIFIITPFRSVADSMRKHISDYFEGDSSIKKWVNECVGTVHTFQGKDANEVLFVLGCSYKSDGAMEWVVSKPNILNVACTRAKYRIAFIGNIDDWKNRDFFNKIIPQIVIYN